MTSGRWRKAEVFKSHLKVKFGLKGLLGMGPGKKSLELKQNTVNIHRAKIRKSMPVNRPIFLNKNAKYKEMGSGIKFGKLNEIPANEKTKANTSYYVHASIHARIRIHVCKSVSTHTHTFTSARKCARTHMHTRVQRFY